MNKQNILNVNTYIILAILGISLLVLGGSLKNNFTNWDDDIYVLNNFLIQDLSWTNLKKIFFEPMGISKIYRPLAYLTYAIDYNIWGLDPFGYHLSSLILHLINIVLVYYFVRLFSGNKFITSLITLLFAIHPMKVEAVAWIAARVDVLYAMFFLLALIFYTLYLRRAYKIQYLVSSILFFLLSLLSKPAAVVFPMVCFLIDYYHGRKWNIRIVLEKIPYLLLAIAMGVITLLAQRPDSAAVGIANFSIMERFFLSTYSLMFYFFKTIFPIKISNFYDFPQKLSFLHYVSPLFILVLAFIMYKNRLNKSFIFSMLFFITNLLLVIHIIPTGNRFITADRYVYIAQLGLLLAIMFIYLSAKENGKNIITGSLVVLSIFYLAVTFNRNAVWNNGVTLWADAVAKNPQCSFCNFGLGNALINTNQHALAQPYVEQSLAINPNFAEGYHSRGIIRFTLKNYEGALQDLNKSISLNPTYQYTYASRGSVYATIKKYGEAIEDYNKALAMNPNDMPTYLNRGMARVQLRDFQGAKNDLTIYINFNPQNMMAYYHRGLANANLGQLAECCSDWKKAYDGGIRELRKNLVEACGYSNL
jgi:tetratricopeptide (TPR) repeat protein